QKRYSKQHANVPMFQYNFVAIWSAAAKVDICLSNNSRLSNVSAHGPKSDYLLRQCFWLISNN
ncbi:MAG TPA: hypothetical protein DCE52_08005, partial [Rhodobacteraceae bacterium]|nr:hypothetical protein [Paracoccaceae bacterium]